MILTGVFAGPIAGLKYVTPSCEGVTSATGEFRYRKGERIAFLLGDSPIGYALGCERLTLADIISRVDGNIHKLMDAGLTNVARLLCTLDRDGNLDNGIEIAPEVHAIIGKRRINFRHDVSFAGAAGDQVAAFAADPLVAELLDACNASGMFTARAPRTLFPAAAARNEVRRNLLGILRFRDVKVPLANGSYVVADIFRPAKDGKYPVVMNCGPYGRAFNHHTVCNEADFEHHEEEEERYFHGNADGLVFENHESVNTAAWVPHDYAVMRVDGPGMGKSPGKLAIWGYSTAEAYRDAIDWAGVQDWCNGNVGLWGMSYYAMTQHQAAALAPRHLKAMIAIGTDVDMYEEVLYTGGILNEEFFPHWYKGGVLPAVCGEPDAIDFMAVARACPFKDSDPAAIFGPRGEVFMSPDMRGVTVPTWTVACTTHPAHFHQLGSSEAYLTTPTPHKKIDFREDWFTRSYSAAMVAEHMAFFDHWLKGIDNGVMDKPPVTLEVRAGYGSSYEQHEQEWPVARTEYCKYHLDLSPSDWAGDAHRNDFRRLSLTEAATAGEASYSAEIPVESRTGPPAALLPVMPPSALLLWKTGVSFISDPVAEDMVFAGYSKAKLWVSSSAADMDIYVTIRVIDADGEEVDYAGPTTMGLSVKNYPLAKGWLKASHRKIDEARTTEYTVKHTHLKADHAPLQPGEIVPVEIEIIPNVALIRAGHRIRIDIQPYDGFGHGTRHGYDASYHDGATNMIHTGPDHPSWVQLPIVPNR
ncbi:CocE/NonD family hydrolase [Sphingomonas sp. MG17]|uniref:CocE/NonD family hydrolase n=1 Tax=Sphingomonas tagetis TaxID=2949092 RepID=A0A9X2HJ05_9SPHN|nr:CocE/NonD family hydrolase [Sphingomonas tagetis]MCP3729989.1 CocE/NonD family hydrolase [Sphingomonas tagetis]